MNYKLTVIATAFNNPVSLLQMVCNFKLQTRQDFLLHIIHDGRNEELYEFIKPHLANNMIWSDMDGPSGAGNYPGRNKALKHVKTPYVMFASDDNYYVPKFVEFMLEVFEQNPLVKAISCRCLHNYSSYQYDAVNKPIFKTGYIDLGQTIFDYETIKEIGFFKEDMPEGKIGTQDGDLCERLAEKYPNDIRCTLDLCLYVHN